ncbi:CPBP family intramembrane glutamic endopeptidase [Psychroserpens jangbogonensis]|uniref:CPBP family intramembrane glutamic endopeptidase n=1 Tax=Psychroserpens jangbogonensis TaxID=1484460 RepID=UPI00053F0827|nr:CPBP family intramembrane glutamic endopeptidase [Psychroserpens jangbogonensis]
MSLENQFKKEPTNSLFKRVRHLLKQNKLAKIIEILAVFLVAFLFIMAFQSDDASDLVYNQAIVWFANIIMLTIVFAGIKLRGEGLEHFGFTFKKITWKIGLKTTLQSILVFILALVGFIIGSIIMANITDIPKSSDMSGYEYIKDNIGMLMLTLFGVYIVASFGEEVIYRAFLINRISELGITSKTGRVIVVIISAVVFGLAHYSWGIMGIVQTSFMGLALGCSYVYLKKRIWVLILAHAYMDTILMVQLYLR